MSKRPAGRFSAMLASAALAVLAALPASAQEALQELDLTVNDAVVTMLQNNRSLQIRKLTPDITGLNELHAKSVFDPSLTSSLSTSNSSGPGTPESRSTKGSVGLSKTFVTGTQVSASLSTDNSNSRSNSSQYSTRLVISLNQPLLRGAGSAVNLVSLHQSELDTKTSRLELQAYSESLVNQVISAYWDYALAQRKLQIYEDSVKLSEQQLDETKTMVDVGKLAEIELVGANAEVSSRRQSLINVQSQFESLRIRLLGLLHPADSGFWDSSIVVKDQLIVPDVTLGDLEAHVKSALEARPDLLTARIAFERGTLDVVKTKNGLLPLLTFFITLGNTDYANAFLPSYGSLVTDFHDVQAGLNYSVKLGRRSEKASYEQSLLRKEQSGIAIENMESSVQQDVRNAWIEILRSKSQIAASESTFKLQDEKLRAETEKYRIGRSTVLNVAIAQRDLLQSRVDAAQAVADYIKALQALYLAEGSLLNRFGASVQ